MSTTGFGAFGNRKASKMSAKDISEEHSMTTPMVRDMGSPKKPKFSIDRSKSNDRSMELRDLK